MRDFLVNILGAVKQSSLMFVTDFVLYIPSVIAALVVLALGVWLARVVYSAFKSFFDSVSLDDLFASIGLQKFFHEVGLDFSISRLLAWCFRFFILFITVLSVLSILGLSHVVEYINVGLVAFVPTVVTVAALLFFTFVIADRVREFILHTTLLAKNLSPMTARVVWLLIVLVGVLTALDYLKIATFLVNMAGFMFMALFAGASLAIGLAFGFGAKEEARCLVRGWMGKDCDDLDCGCDHGECDHANFECCPCECKKCGEECEDCSCCFGQKDAE